MNRRPDFWTVLRSRILFFLLTPLLITCQGERRTEILWDSYGVPHIFSHDAEALFRAQGWAQMEAHGNLILRLYGQARGRAAEYWGQDYLSTDLQVRTLSIPQRADAWVGEQDPEMRRYLDAFVIGMNDYARERPETLDENLRRVLPLRTVDALAHLQRVIHFNFVSSPSPIPGRYREALYAEALVEDFRGSNAWAIGPSRSASGNAMLLANPHLPWDDFFLWFENHLVGPDFDAYGATLVGMPLVTIGFNESLGWTHTVNTYDGSDVYELHLEGEGYRYDGGIREFQEHLDTLRVRGDDGTMQEHILLVRRSVHGPVIGIREGRAYALRVAGLDEPEVFRQYYSMLEARNLEEFEGAMGMMQMPMFTTMYADRDGHIMHLFNGLVPLRSEGDVAYWAGTIPGDSSRTLWTAFYGAGGQNVPHPYAGGRWCDRQRP